MRDNVNRVYIYIGSHLDLPESINKMMIVILSFFKCLLAVVLLQIIVFLESVNIL